MNEQTLNELVLECLENARQNGHDIDSMDAEELAYDLCDLVAELEDVRQDLIYAEIVKIRKEEV